MHDAQLDIGTQNQRQRVKPISHAYAMARSNIIGIMPLKQSGGLTLEIPARIYDTEGGSMYFAGIKRIDAVQGEIGYNHNVYS